jgi:hypothetical protein
MPQSQDDKVECGYYRCDDCSRWILRPLAELPRLFDDVLPIRKCSRCGRGCYAVRLTLTWRQLGAIGLGVDPEKFVLPALDV